VFIESIFDVPSGLFNVFELRSTSDDEFPTPKEKYDDVRVIESVDKPREVLRFVFAAFEP
jgi:hypothetical protein